MFYWLSLLFLFILEAFKDAGKSLNKNIFRKNINNWFRFASKPKNSNNKPTYISLA